MGWEDGFRLELTDEERMVQEAARSFASEKVAPIAAALDRERRFPKELIGELGSLGFLGAMCPQEFGGSELSQAGYCLVVEELAAACASTSIIVSAHNSLAMWPIVKYGTSAQKERYLPIMASGKGLGCFALSEPGTGSDAAALSCSVKKDGDDYIVNGAKNWITNGPVADVCILFAMQESTRGARGITAFVHPMNLPGVSRGKPEDKLGICASPTCGITYDNVRLSKEHLLFEECKGFVVGMTTLDGGRMGVAAQAIGIARAALKDALSYSRTRQTFGKYLYEHQSIQNYFADMVMRIDAARYLTIAAARLKDSGQPHTREAAMAKLFASEAASFCATKGLQVFGGYGYVKDFPAERHLRDARITEIYEGTSEIQRLVIAGGLIREGEGK